jgi:hypothetical protein
MADTVKSVYRGEEGQGHARRTRRRGAPGGGPRGPQALESGLPGVLAPGGGSVVTESSSIPGPGPSPGPRPGTVSCRDHDYGRRKKNRLAAVTAQTRGSLNNSGGSHGGAGQQQQQRQQAPPQPQDTVVLEPEIPVRVFEGGTDGFILTPTVTTDPILRDFALWIVKKEDFQPSQSQIWIRKFVYSLLYHFSDNPEAHASPVLRSLTSCSGLTRLADILVLPMELDAGDKKNKLSFQNVVLPLIGVLTRERLCGSKTTTMTTAATQRMKRAIFSTVYKHQEQFLKEGILRCMTEAVARKSLVDKRRDFLPAKAADCTGRTPSVPHVLLAIIRLSYQLVINTEQISLAMVETLQALHSLTDVWIRTSNNTPSTQSLRDVLSAEWSRLFEVAIEPFICKNHFGAEVINISPETLKAFVLKNDACTDKCGRLLLCGHTCPLRCRFKTFALSIASFYFFT